MIMVMVSGMPAALVVLEPKLEVMSLRTMPLSVSTFAPLEPSPGYGPAVSSGSSPLAVSLVSPLSGGAPPPGGRPPGPPRGAPLGAPSEPGVPSEFGVGRAGAEGDQAGPGESGPGHELQQAPAFQQPGEVVVQPTVVVFQFALAVIDAHGDQLVSVGFACLTGM